MSLLTSLPSKSMISKTLLGALLLTVPLTYTCYGSSSTGTQDTFQDGASDSTTVGATVRDAAILYAGVNMVDQYVVSPLVGFIGTRLPTYEDCFTRVMHRLGYSTNSSPTMEIEQILSSGNGVAGIRPEFADLVQDINHAFIEHMESLEDKTGWVKRPIIDRFMPYPRHLIGYQYTSPTFTIDIYRVDEAYKPVPTLYTLNKKISHKHISFDKLQRPLNAKDSNGKLPNTYNLEGPEATVPSDPSETEAIMIRNIQKLLSSDFSQVSDESSVNQEKPLPTSFKTEQLTELCLKTWEIPDLIKFTLANVFMHTFLSDVLEGDVSLDTNNATFKVPFIASKKSSNTLMSQITLHFSRIQPRFSTDQSNTLNEKGKLLREVSSSSPSTSFHSFHSASRVDSLSEISLD